jgi:hypothetical protein
MRHDVQINMDEVHEKLHEISASLRSIDYDGSYFEITEANKFADSDNIMLHFSTYRSAITNNPGNAWELAVQALRYPNHRQLYIASFGIGGSVPLRSDERRYARKYGRFTMDLGNKAVPLPTIRNLHYALKKENLHVTRLMGTDSAGGPYASALGLAMKPDQLTHAFFSERSGFVNLSRFAITKGMFFVEQRVNNKQNKNISPDPYALTDLMIEQARQALAENEECENRKRLYSHMTSNVDMLRSLWTSMEALRRGPTKRGSPLVEDTLALQSHHPSARLTFGVAERDELYKGVARSHTAAQEFLGTLAANGGTARVVMIPGMTHAYNTYFPSIYHSVKR